MKALNKIGFLIPVRLSSERLPRKAIRIINGRKTIEHIFRRIKKSKYYHSNNIVVCTTNLDSDNILESYLIEQNIKVYRGDTNDIIARFYNASKKFDLDYLIQIDGDDPITETIYMDLCMDELLKDETLGIVYPVGLPLGMASKAFTFKALEKIYKQKLDEKNDTGFIYYFTKTNLVKSKIISDIPKEHIQNQARLTLDYNEDLIFFNKLLKIAEPDDEVAGIEKTVKILNENPDLIKMNSYLNEKYYKRTKELTSLHFKDEKGEVHKIE